MNPTRSVTATCLTLLSMGTPVVAQDLSEVCPGAEGGTGALWGLLSDADAQMGLPGATVVASWTIDGVSGRAEVQTSIDGSFTMCYVPLDTELSVLGMIGSIPGRPFAVTLTDPITRLDLEVSLTGANAGGEKMLACPGAPNSQLRLQVSDLVHCDPRWRGLENCPREDLGRVSVASPDTPSLSDRLPGLALLITQARELGANALLNFWESGIVGRRSAGSPGGGLLSAQAVFIDVDPATC
jgi:hypothetical protein